MRFKIIILAFILNGISGYGYISAQTVYKPEWESLDRHKMPKWYDDSKIGLSMHWGVYSVPSWAPREEGISYAEWYGFRMHEKGNPTVDYHRENWGENFTYDDFIPMWKAEEL